MMRGWQKRWALFGAFFIAVLAIAVGGQAGVVPACAMYATVATAFVGGVAYQQKKKE